MINSIRVFCKNYSGFWYKLILDDDIINIHFVKKIHSILALKVNVFMYEENGIIKCSTNFINDQVKIKNGIKINYESNITKNETFIRIKECLTEYLRNVYFIEVFQGRIDVSLSSVRILLQLNRINEAVRLLNKIKKSPETEILKYYINKNSKPNELTKKLELEDIDFNINITDLFEPFNKNKSTAKYEISTDYLQLPNKTTKLILNLSNDTSIVIYTLLLIDQIPKSFYNKILERVRKCKLKVFLLLKMIETTKNLFLLYELIKITNSAVLENYLIIQLLLNIENRFIRNKVYNKLKFIVNIDEMKYNYWLIKNEKYVKTEMNIMWTNSITVYNVYEFDVFKKLSDKFTTGRIVFNNLDKKYIVGLFCGNKSKFFIPLLTNKEQIIINLKKYTNEKEVEIKYFIVQNKKGENDLININKKFTIIDGGNFILINYTNEGPIKKYKFKSDKIMYIKNNFIKIKKINDEYEIEKKAEVKKFVLIREISEVILEEIEINF
ncbi:hypothetical protein NUSPORA_01391 [Nucleospora cyclopteri]